MSDDPQEVNQANRSDLRTRIANALRNMTGPNASGDPISYEGMADAVIRELGLTYSCQYCGGWGPDHE